MLGQELVDELDKRRHITAADCCEVAATERGYLVELATERLERLRARLELRDLKTAAGLVA